MSDIEKNEIIQRVNAMDDEEKMLVARTLPSELIAQVMRENLRKGANRSES